MVSVTYTHRIICDCNFISWLLKQPDKNTLYSQLLHIKSSSEQWKKLHNLILKSEYQNGKSKLSIDQNGVGAIFKIIEDPDFLENYKDQITKNVIFSIDMTDERPFKCYFLTSPDMEEEYKKNKHYTDITSVEFACGEKAKKVIKDFFLAFDVERQAAR